MLPDSLGPEAAFFVTGMISLWVIVDPPGNIFAFLALSAGYAQEASRALARRACTFAFLILTVFIFLGRLVLGFLASVCLLSRLPAASSCCASPLTC